MNGKSGRDIKVDIFFSVIQKGPPIWRPSHNNCNSSDSLGVVFDAR